MVYHLDLVGLVDHLGWTIPQFMNNNIQAIDLYMVYHLNLMGLVNHLSRTVL